MDAAALTWLAVGFGLLGTVLGVVGTNLYARRLARDSGSLDKPDLAIGFEHLPGGPQRTVTVVLPEQPMAPVVWRLIGTIRNRGKRAAQQVLAQVVLPKPVIDQTAPHVFSHPGLALGLESKHEVVGEFSITMASWPHIAPNDAVGLSQECRLESTLLDLVLSDVRTTDGSNFDISAKAEVAWMATLQVRSLDAGWQQTSVIIRVAVGRSVEEVAQAQRKEIEEKLRTTSGMASARGVRRSLTRLKHWRLTRSTPASYFVTPRLRPIDGGRVEADVAGGVRFTPNRGGFLMPLLG